MSLESPKLDQWTSGPAYDTFMGRWSVLLAQEFLNWLRLPAAQHVLDVCCGSGILSHAIASQCSPALVAAVDRAPTQVSFARTHRAHPRISFALAVDPEAASFDQGRRFPICKAAGLRDAFFAAQFDNPELHALEIITRFESFDDYWEPFSTRQGSAPNYLLTRPPSIHAAIRDRLKANLPAAPDGSIILPARAWAIRARRASPANARSI